MPTTSVEAPPLAAASFRDPSGSMFECDGRLMRRINRVYADDYEHLMVSGLYRELTDDRLLVPHLEIVDRSDDAHGAYKLLEPERIRFVSYPFEWTFGELKSAALATLAIQRRAVKHGMVLKDASAYNIQFRGTAPVLIDTLSFERWQEGTPWVAYRQFCQHFLGPLALMSRGDARLGQLSRLFIDGAPLDLVSRLLPFSSRFSPSLLMHLHLHARAQSRNGGQAVPGRPQTSFKRQAMLGLIDSLESAIATLSYQPGPTEWSNYYEQTNYSNASMADKHRLVDAFIGRERPEAVWDLGANTGAFSRLASARGIYTLAFDGDPAAVERHFQDAWARRDPNVLPLVMDLANPSSRIGWDHAERLSLADRGPADLVLALGLVHHLRLSNQVPFAMIAEFLQRIGRSLVIELPSPDDSQVQPMLARMPSLRDSYSREAFEQAFAACFDVIEAVPIEGAKRWLYYMRRRAGDHTWES